MSDPSPYRQRRERADCRPWPPKFTAETRERALHLLAAGEPIARIAKACQTSPGPIRSLIAALASAELGEAFDRKVPAEGDEPAKPVGVAEPDNIHSRLAGAARDFVGGPTT